jgi:hypothetical protein
LYFWSLLVNDSEYNNFTGTQPIPCRWCIYLVLPLARAAAAVAAADFAAAAARRCCTRPNRIPKPGGLKTCVRISCAAPGETKKIKLLPAI